MAARLMALSQRGSQILDGKKYNSFGWSWSTPRLKGDVVIITLFSIFWIIGHDLGSPYGLSGTGGMKPAAWKTNHPS